MQPVHPPQSNRPGYFIIGGVILFALVVCGGSLYGSQLSVFFRNLEPSCTLGVGTATITVQAWFANGDCQAMLSGPNNFTGYNWAKIGASAVSEPNVNGVTACEMDMSGRHVIVRDSGNMGGVVCTLLADPSFGQQ